MIFLTGPHCAGKTTIANLLVPHGFSYIDLGPTLRGAYLEESPGVSFEEWLSENEKIKGKHFTDNLLVEEVRKHIQNIESSNNHVQDILICGNRSLGGIQYLCQRLSRFNNKENIIIWVEAPVQILWKRFCADRGQVSINKFKRLLSKDRKLGLDLIRKGADLIISNRGGSIKSLEKKVRELFFTKLPYSQRN